MSEYGSVRSSIALGGTAKISFIFFRFTIEKWNFLVFLKLIIIKLIFLSADMNSFYFVAKYLKMLILCMHKNFIFSAFFSLQAIA